MRASATTVEIFHRGQRVAAHRRADTSAAATPPTPPTCPRPTSAIWSGRPRGIIGWAADDRPADRRARRGHPRRPAPSRAGLSLLPGHPPPGQALRPGPAGSRLRPRRQRRAPARTATSTPSSSTASIRSPLPAAAPQPGAAAHARTRPRPAVLPVKEEPIPMLTAPTLDKLQALKLDAMAHAWTEQQQHAELTSLAFDERFGLLVDAEWLARENKRLTRALKEAKLKLRQACLEAIDYPARRELDKAVIRQLATCRWVQEHQNVILVGATGTGKSFVACALAASGLPQGLPRLLPPRLAPLPRPHPGPRRRHLHPPARQARPRRRPGHRRLGPRARHRPGAPRPARDPRGPLRRPLHDHHQPAAAGPVARLPRRRHPGRRHLRSPPPQRPPARAKRTLTKKGGQARRLTTPSVAALRSRSADRRDHDAAIRLITIAGMRRRSAYGR